MPVVTVKPWLSKTIWLNALGLVIAAIALFVPAASGVASFLQSNAAVVGVVWSGLGIVLRLITKNAVSLVD